MTRPKITLSQAAVTAAIRQSEALTDQPQGDGIDEYEESVASLNRLIERKNPPAPKLIIQLLEEIRQKRKDWLKQDISIHDILEKYICFKKPKWVSYLALHTYTQLSMHALHFHTHAHMPFECVHVL